MISVVRVAPNRSGEIHSRPQEQWGVMLEGSGVRVQGGVEHPVKADDFWQTPGGVPHGFRAGGGNPRRIQPTTGGIQEDRFRFRIWNVNRQGKRT